MQLMDKLNAPRRTGVYRVCGKITEFRMQIKLHHINAWVPLPRLEYAGATSTSSTNSSSDCTINLPVDESTTSSTTNLCYRHYSQYYNRSGFTTRDASFTSSKYTGSSTSDTYGLIGNSNNNTLDRMTISSYSLNSSVSQSEMPNITSNLQSLNQELLMGDTAYLSIGWQQKHFSREEMMRYVNGSRCVTPLERRYHRWAQLQYEAIFRTNMVDLRRRSRRKPSRSSEHGREVKVTLSESQQPEEHNLATHTCLIYTLTDADVDELPEEAKELQAKGFQQLYVFADLQRKQLLVRLHYAPKEGLLHVHPDFSWSVDEFNYVLQIDDDCRQLYAYSFQSDMPLQRISALMKEPPMSWQEMAEAIGESLRKRLEKPHPTLKRLSELPPYAVWGSLIDFELPPMDARRVSIIFQLHEGHGFEYSNVYVRYYVNLPLHTELDPCHDEIFPLSGSTVSCLASGSRNVAKFNRSWQLTFICEEDPQRPEEQLHIYFEVISVDSWQRERCEGYAHLSCSLFSPLPQQVIDGIQLGCVRPMGNWLDALNRYFIGGLKDFDYVEYFSNIDKEHQHKTCPMRRTCSLLFSMQKMQQRKLQFGMLWDSDESDPDDLKKIRRSSLFEEMDKVLESCAEVRLRLEAIVQDIKSQKSTINDKQTD